MERQKVLNVLNKLEVIETNGGDSAYMLVENNEENQELLKEAGIPLETALKYGDEETFCILALAYCEGYADLYDGNKLLAFEEKFEMELGEGQNIILYKNNNEHFIAISKDDGRCWIEKLSKQHLYEINTVLKK
ncbi:hypothetical protein [Virgibacillus sp. Bac330]|uniref:hypothetical protein n=1 Tax=Virgibacillus sp. Bac330 TaxID=2419841 RepID=UPI000EF52BC5|nr:hypothetical protein [Virgibacillus sp. Bac330]